MAVQELQKRLKKKFRKISKIKVLMVEIAVSVNVMITVIEGLRLVKEMMMMKMMTMIFTTKELVLTIHGYHISHPNMETRNTVANPGFSNPCPFCSPHANFKCSYRENDQAHNRLSELRRSGRRRLSGSFTSSRIRY